MRTKSLFDANSLPRGNASTGTSYFFTVAHDSFRGGSVNQKHEITEETAVLQALSLLFPDSSNTTLRHMLRAGRVRVDGQVVRAARLA